MAQNSPDIREDIAAESEDKTTEPPLYKVFLLNDDYTTMEFVVDILVHVFKKQAEEAVQIMLNVHQNGIGLCGIYTYEIAETKVSTVQMLARENGFPLKCTLEKE